MKNAACRWRYIPTYSADTSGQGGRIFLVVHKNVSANRELYDRRMSLCNTVVSHSHKGETLRSDLHGRYICTYYGHCSNVQFALTFDSSSCLLFRCSASSFNLRCFSCSTRNCTSSLPVSSTR
jgi:hypothetical protein